MSKRLKRVLVVDPDDKSRRILEVSLRKAGYDALGAEGARPALALLETGHIDLIISEAALPDASGFDFCRHVRAHPELESVPFIFISQSGDMSEKLRGLELGVEDFLAKPVYVAEVRARVELLLQRRETDLLAEAQAPTVRGRLADISLVDLFRTIEQGRKTGQLRLERDGHRAAVYFSEGEPIDARADLLIGEEAVYRLLAWSDGEFVLKVLPALRRPRRIRATFTDLVVEGLQRSEQFDAVQEEVAPERRVLRVIYKRLAERVDALPEPLQELLRLFDGRRPIGAVVEDSPLGDLATIRVIQRLLEEGLLEEVPASDADDAEVFQALADDALDDWLGEESKSDRRKREEREERRLEEEARLRAELGELEAMQAQLDERVRAAEEARRSAEQASAELRAREKTIRERLTGDYASVPPADVFRSAPSAERRAVMPRMPGTQMEAAGDWMRVASDPALTNRAEADRIDTFDYPALKVPTEDPVEPPTGFKARPSRIDTNPRFRTDMASEPPRAELQELRQSVDAERRRLEQARRAARDEERKATETQRALDRARTAYEELERTEELRKLQAEQTRLENERHALIAQRERLQAELEAERTQLQQEQDRLRVAAETRHRAQAEEESRLRAELERARREREEEERRLQAHREQAERLRREAEAQAAALHARSGKYPALGAPPTEAIAAPTTLLSAPVAPPPSEPREESNRAVLLDALPELSANEGERVTGPLPAAVKSELEVEVEKATESEVEADRRLRAVEEARRRLLDAAQRSEEKLIGRRPDTPGASVPSVTRREPTDTPQRLAAISESRRRLSSLLNEAVAEPAARREPSTELGMGASGPPPTPRVPTPTGGLRAARPPAIPQAARVAERFAAAPPLPAIAPLRPEEPTPDGLDTDPLGSLAEGAVAETGDDLEADFFSANHEDIYQALYDGEAPSSRGRSILWAAALGVVAFLIAFAVVSGTGGNHEESAPTPPPGPSAEELEAGRIEAGVEGRTVADGVSEFTVAASREVAVEVAFEQAGEEVGLGLRMALGPEETAAIDPFANPPLGEGELADLGATEPLLGDTQPAELDTALAETPAETATEPGERRAEAETEAPQERAERPAVTDEDDDSGGLDPEEGTRQARELLGHGEPGEAAAMARAVLEQDPGNRRAHEILGEALLNLDDAREAVSHLQAATRSRRPDDRALLLLGNAQLELGDEGAARETWTRYLELYPNNAEAQELRGFLGL